MLRRGEARICTACYVTECFFYSLYTMLVILGFCKSEQERERRREGDIKTERDRETRGGSRKEGCPVTPRLGGGLVLQALTVSVAS